MQSKYEICFWQRWPDCLQAIQQLYGCDMHLPDVRYEKVADRLAALHQKPTTNEIEKTLRLLWDFDSRFHGDLIGFDSGNYEWAVYSLCYLTRDEAIIEKLLKIFVPMLDQHIEKTLGQNFRTKVGATFMDDVGHYLWDVQGLTAPEDHGLFDWHGNRNHLSEGAVADFLKFANLPPLPNPDFPPSWVLLSFTNLQGPFATEKEYLRGLAEYYQDQGYDISL